MNKKFKRETQNVAGEFAKNATKYNESSKFEIFIFFSSQKLRETKRRKKSLQKSNAINLNRMIQRYHFVISN